MRVIRELATPRLLLRQWKDTDLDRWAELNADPEVRRHLGPVLDRAEAAAALEHFRTELGQRGWGWWAVELRSEQRFLGFAGLDPVDDGMPVTGIEAGWRLHRDAWGHGYATEAGRAVLHYAFEELGLPEILALIAADNAPSRAVARRLGMAHDPAADFLDPDLPPGPGQRAVVYRLARP
ncbi:MULTISPECIES: GNAT family N-acetyltransferase [Kitasatospora]|uniref:Putative acetyltransferase n=1 Tax=Kitasatospora setae (strain ATCC 33774 / DSM 43861 / JCM 3304 / KCC A-0304 / NBRC 14216 / KM-6054) TaxID=452652 RepID=E4N6Y9_KITSK|nr:MULTISPECIES: GNAT family N-acetyltransferase [Kitasatospora]BAJ26970.1 putative acetyltransferase [Kitasatospora setae KM-6054]